MKKLFTFFVMVAITYSGIAQTPQKMSYQCVVRNADGDLVTNKSIGMKISIMQGSATGTLVYQEIYNPNPQTNANGLASIEIGGGIPVTTGTFSDINWASGPYFLKTETDPTGSTNYTISGTTQLLSVPYALYSKTTSNFDALQSQINMLKNSLAGAGIVNDYDNNIYNTVKIGTQIWMAENLKTTKYNDGTAVPYVTDNSVWSALTSGAYCWYNNDASTYKDTYGALYNWYTVNTGKLCPTGWHVPTDAEWATLENYLGGSSVAGGKMKETGTTQWTGPNTGADNSSGFTPLPGGYRDNTGLFNLIFNVTGFLSSSEDNDLAINRSPIYFNATLRRFENDKRQAESVRCIKD